MLAAVVSRWRFAVPIRWALATGAVMRRWLADRDTTIGIRPPAGRIDHQPMRPHLDKGAPCVSVYQAAVDPAETNTSHALMLELVGPDKAVLDVGCASGYLAEALGKNGCVVSGIEYDLAEAEKARPFLSELVVADLNAVSLADKFAPASFDAIVFGDVLEHLLDPLAVLKSSLGLLAPGGTIVISIPNVAHGAVRLSLLQGRWNYTPTGLLDRTHVRFFTFETLTAMLHGADLTVTDWRSTVADPLHTEVGIDGNALPLGAVDWVRRQPHAEAYQFVLAAQVGSADVEESEIQVLPAIVVEPLHDVHTEVADLIARVAHLEARNVELRRDVLTGRDHAIGAEAQLGQVRSELARAKLEAHAARADAHYAHTELAKAIKDAQNAHARLAASRPPVRIRVLIAKVVGPRAWQLMTAPFRPLYRRMTGQQ